MGDHASLEQALQGWKRAQTALLAFLDSVGATEDAHTITIRLIPRKIKTPKQFADWLNARVRTDGTWSFVTTTADRDGQRYGFAMPVSRWRAEDALIFPFVEVHTLLIAWWLTTAWRCRQLARAALTMAEGDDAIAAASCTRPLVETAASCWVDGAKLAAAWDNIKRAGTPETDGDAFERRTRMLQILNEVTWGAKFDDRAPKLKQLWNKVERSNVLGQVEKLAKVAGRDIQDDYQWLCNTVHPSIGNTFVFSAPPLMHETRTHMKTFFAGRPISITGRSETYAERTVQSATARAADRALLVLQSCLDDALRFIDDVALTTGAPSVSRDAYWRNLTTPERNQLCPCRSQRKTKHCSHVWGEPAPAFPTSFVEQPGAAHDG